MHKNGTNCNETLSKWCKNKHGASKIMDTLETYHCYIHQTLLLGFSNWPVIYYTQSSFLASSSPRHQQVFLASLPGRKEDFFKGSFARTSFTLFYVLL
jgi:hypothetical protein